MKKVLVTGSNGFIGKHVLDPLKSRGYEVYALYNNTSPVSEGLQLVKCDLMDSVNVSEMMQQIRPNYLLHLAWYTSHGKFWDAPENFQWVKASIQLLEEFAKVGGKRVLMAGSCAEYDWSKNVFSENDLSSMPQSFYGKSKNCLRILSEVFAEMNSISLAWGRVFFIHGPYEPPKKIVASVITNLLKGVPAPIQNGNLIRDYLHVTDMARALVHLFDSELKGVVNIASGEAVSLKILGETLEDLIGTNSLLQIGSAPPDPATPVIMAPDTYKLKEVLGWKPLYSLEEGLLQSVNWWQEQLNESPI